MTKTEQIREEFKKFYYTGNGNELATFPQIEAWLFSKLEEQKQEIEKAEQNRATELIRLARIGYRAELVEEIEKLKDGKKCPELWGCDECGGCVNLHDEAIEKVLSIIKSND